MGGYVFGYVVGYLLYCLIFGFVSKTINQNKGYDGGFAWGFWLGILGVIVVACKPDNRSYSDREYKPMYPSAIQPEKKWRCGYCGHENAEKIKYCTYCHRDRYVIEKITCPHCGAVNNNSNAFCFACSNPLHQEETKKVTEAEPVIAPPTDNDKTIELIKKLSELHENGILTDDEFNTKKSELLSKM